MTWPSSDGPEQPPADYPQQPYAPYPPAPPEQYPQQYGYAGYAPPPYLANLPPTNGLGITGFVTGLVGVLLFWVPFGGLVLGVAGVVFSSFGMAHNSRHRSGIGLSVAGLVLGIIATLLGVLIVVSFLNGGYND